MTTSLLTSTKPTAPLVLNLVLMDAHVLAYKHKRTEAAIARKAAKKLKAETIATRVLRFRLKDRHAPLLKQWAAEVNFVWNFCNALAIKSYEREHRFLHPFEYAEYTKGAGKCGLHLHSQTIQAIGEEFATRRSQFSKVKLAWRKSKGVRRSLGWIPLKASALSFKNGQLWVSGIEYQETHFKDHHLGVPQRVEAGAKRPLCLWDSYGLAEIVKAHADALGPSTLSEDARGRWYINITVKVNKKPKQTLSDLAAPEAPVSAIGIDLGLKDLATYSNGETIEAKSFYRNAEEQLAIAQRANKKKRVKAIHAKIANRRKDHHHQLSTALVKRYAAIFVGNVNAQALAKTKMAKSVLDAAWSALRTMLLYKCDDAGRWFGEVNESFTTQDCSACGARCGPKGPEDLGIREWICESCGTHHQRDVNAAKNILARGLARLDGGIPVLSA